MSRDIASSEPFQVTLDISHRPYICISFEKSLFLVFWQPNRKPTGQSLLLSNLAPDSMHEQLYVCSCIAHSVMSFCFGGYTGSHKHNSWGGYSEEEFNHPIVMNSLRPFYVGQLLDIRVITVLKLQAVYEVQIHLEPVWKFRKCSLIGQQVCECTE